MHEDKSSVDDFIECFPLSLFEAVAEMQNIGALQSQNKLIEMKLPLKNIYIVNNLEKLPKSNDTCKSFLNKKYNHFDTLHNKYLKPEKSIFLV